MMVSQKQLEANRRNTEKGGVRSEEGKTVSRLNATKHGLLSREVLLEGESQEELDELEDRILRELQPEGEVERILVDRIVSSYWRLRRALRVERAHMEYEYQDGLRDPLESDSRLRPLAAMVDMLRANSTEKILRYETALERQFYKALHELQRLQAAKYGAKPPAPLAIDVDVAGDSRSAPVTQYEL
jgi:hypothetical protein